MSTYAIRMHHNETAETEGETTEYKMKSGDLERYSDDDVTLRLLEAQTIGIANLAESAERIAVALEALAHAKEGL